MADSKPLYPTKTRLALLEGIDKGEVTGYPSCGHAYVEYVWNDGSYSRLVNGRIAEFIAAGWTPPFEPDSARPSPDFKVRLSEVGRKVLEASRGD